MCGQSIQYSCIMLLLYTTKWPKNITAYSTLYLFFLFILFSSSRRAVTSAKTKRNIMRRVAKNPTWRQALSPVQRLTLLLRGGGGVRLWDLPRPHFARVGSSRSRVPFLHQCIFCFIFYFFVFKSFSQKHSNDITPYCTAADRIVYMWLYVSVYDLESV